LVVGTVLSMAHPAIARSMETRSVHATATMQSTATMHAAV
jgi:hypothetical protein